MKKTPHTAAEVEKIMDKFLTRLQEESIENYGKIEEKLAQKLYLSEYPDDDTIYEDYNTDPPSPVDEEPEYESDEELYIKSRHGTPLQLN